MWAKSKGRYSEGALGWWRREHSGGSQENQSLQVGSCVSFAIYGRGESQEPVKIWTSNSVYCISHRKAFVRCAMDRWVVYKGPLVMYLMWIWKSIQCSISDNMILLLRIRLHLWEPESASLLQEKNIKSIPAWMWQKSWRWTGATGNWHFVKATYQWSLFIVSSKVILCVKVFCGFRSLIHKCENL